MTAWIDELIAEATAAVRERSDQRVAERFERCFADTLHSTMTPMPDGTVFMLTGDIPAMWLRDSSAQLAPYLHFAADRPELADLLVAVNRRQLDAIALDPYANAFNAEPNGHGHHDDRTDASAWVWERKYEIDSLCYPLQLAHDLWLATGRSDHLDDRYHAAVTAAMGVWRTEQHHEERSPYRFQRFDAPLSDTLVRNGLGPETAFTGLSWSGFRPSDDAARYGYNVPGNLFAAVTLAGVETIAVDVLDDEVLAADARSLRLEIEAAIDAHGVVSTDRYGDVYAYEVDGFGNALLMDDANVPSLLSLPFLGWCAPDDARYLATRRFLLSDDDPSFFIGSAARGIGSPHTPPDHIWPIALAMEGLTSTDDAERARLLDTLLRTDAGTGVMHESFHKDDPATFTRPWFSWANAMFCEFVLDVVGLRTHVRRPVPRGA
ncbi:glycoside hydrolase family 125 protein [Plantibacter sp. VKM Ac-2880]|uniref:glycoside hydrolase family 125 protein n=1 Tax=Plantibacter sp. VKM Ac-2880 TaxID=2783827 RepID=UPI00188E9308|nr:glycoside hydrolase family 125 protein [Plantibacter sp. VKM Ac-2880]MBF4567447.1 glycoside hydrolase family 125 protein [Plantibacter sp. VKM Ac-2880]